MINISIYEHVENLSKELPVYNLQLLRSGILPSHAKKSFIEKGIQAWLEANKNNPALLAEYHQYLAKQSKIKAQKDIEHHAKEEMNAMVSNLFITNPSLHNSSLIDEKPQEHELKKEKEMVKLAQAMRQTTSTKQKIETILDTDNYWTAWNKKAKHIENNDFKDFESLKKIMISDSVINLIKSSLSSFKGQEIVVPPQYKNEVFSSSQKEASILKAFETISSQNNGNPFSIGGKENSQQYEIYNAVNTFNRKIPSIDTIDEAYNFIQTTFNFTMNRYIFNLKNQHEVTEEYFPETIKTIEHNLNIFAGVTYLLYAEYEKQYNSEEKYQHKDNLINNKEKFEELLFYVSHAFLQTQNIKTKINDMSQSPSSNKQQDFMIELLNHTADLSNLRDKYLLNFDVISSFLEANHNKSQNIINNAQISKIYIPEISNVVSQQLNDINLSSMSPNFLLDYSLLSSSPHLLEKELERKKHFFFADTERKVKERAEQSMKYFDPTIEKSSSSISYNSRSFKR